MKFLIVKELKEQIANLPDEMKVAVHCEISGDQDRATEIIIVSQANSPGAKGDHVWDLYHIDEDEEVLFVT